MTNVEAGMTQWWLCDAFIWHLLLVGAQQLECWIMINSTLAAPLQYTLVWQFLQLFFNTLAAPAVYLRSKLGYTFQHWGRSVLSFKLAPRDPDGYSLNPSHVIHHPCTTEGGQITLKPG